MTNSLPTPPLPGAFPGSDARTLMLYDANKKSLLISYLLWFFLGALGGHRFYSGRIGTAILTIFLWVFGGALLAAGGVGGILILVAVVWWFVDAFLIPGWIRNHNNLLAHQLGNA